MLEPASALQVLGKAGAVLLQREIPEDVNTEVAQVSSPAFLTVEDWAFMCTNLSATQAIPWHTAGLARPCFSILHDGKGSNWLHGWTWRCVSQLMLTVQSAPAGSTKLHSWLRERGADCGTARSDCHHGLRGGGGAHPPRAAAQCHHPVSKRDRACTLDRCALSSVPCLQPVCMAELAKSQLPCTHALSKHHTFVCRFAKADWQSAALPHLLGKAPLCCGEPPRWLRGHLASHLDCSCWHRRRVLWQKCQRPARQRLRPQWSPYGTREWSR